MPWKILQIGEPGRTVEQFFYDVAWAKILAITSVFIVNCVADVPPARAQQRNPPDQKQQYDLEWPKVWVVGNF